MSSVLAGLLVLCPRTAGAGTDVQYWPQMSVKLVDTPQVDWSMYFEGRLYRDASDVGLWMVSQKLSYDVIKHVGLGTNYTYLEYKSFNPAAGRDEFRFQHRVELEVNPYFDITRWLKFDNRNRVEFRWIEDKGSWNTRFRHRFRLTVPLKDLGPLKNVYADSEFFYNQAEHSYDENRSVPFGASFTLTDKASLSVFYMIQSKKGGGDWSSAPVVGTLLSVRF